MSQSSAPKRDVRFVTVEPGRISLHGVALTDAEMAMLKAIAERMKVSRRSVSVSDFCQHGIHWDNACGACEPSRGTKC